MWWLIPVHLQSHTHKAEAEGFYHKFEANLGYILSPRLACATEQDHLKGKKTGSLGEGNYWRPRMPKFLQGVAVGRTTHLQLAGSLNLPFVFSTFGLCGSHLRVPQGYKAYVKLGWEKFGTVIFLNQKSAFGIVPLET